MRGKANLTTRSSPEAVRSASHATRTATKPSSYPLGQISQTPWFTSKEHPPNHPRRTASTAPDLIHTTLYDFTTSDAPPMTAHDLIPDRNTHIRFLVRQLPVTASRSATRIEKKVFWVGLLSVSVCTSAKARAFFAIARLSGCCFFRLPIFARLWHLEFCVLARFEEKWRRGIGCFCSGFDDDDDDFDDLWVLLYDDMTDGWICSLGVFVERG